MCLVDVSLLFVYKSGVKHLYAMPVLCVFPKVKFCIINCKTRNVMLKIIIKNKGRQKKEEKMDRHQDKSKT